VIEFDITANRQLLHRIHRRRIFRRAWLILLGFGLVVSAAFHNIRLGRINYLETVALTVFGMAVLMYVTAFFRQRILTERIVREIGDAPIHYVLSEDCVSATSPLGKTELRWKALKELEITAEYTLVKWGSNTFVSLPTSQIPKDAQQFFIEQFRKHGLKVRDKRAPNQAMPFRQAQGPEPTEGQRTAERSDA
jgi:4-amino-4-deoxy-L-arabinose transferase-like glycosyltransferase